MPVDSLTPLRGLAGGMRAAALPAAGAAGGAVCLFPPMKLEILDPTSLSAAKFLSPWALFLSKLPGVTTPVLGFVSPI